MSQSILIVEDESSIREPLVRYFENNQFRVKAAANAAEARTLLSAHAFDLVISDIMMPGEDGLSLCRHVRSTSNVPVILLTARSEELDRVLGLEVGADDYVVKPFSPRELLARVKAVLRRREHPAETNELIEVGELRLDCRTQEVTVRGSAVELSTLEFKLLRFLATHPSRIFSRDKL